MIRMCFIVATLLTMFLTDQSVFAQGNPPHNAWCLRTGRGTRNCTFANLQQCQASRHGTETCVRNSSQ